MSLNVQDFLEELMDVWNRLSTSGIVSSKDSRTFSSLGTYFYDLGQYPKYDIAINFLVGPVCPEDNNGSN